MQLSLPEHIESINLNDLYSESACLNCAYTAGIIDDLCGSHALPTVSGRMSSNSFDFQIKNSNGEVYHDISVANSQVEIDGGYETEQNLILIEAKNYSADDFLIRQLYYPYRLWHDKISKPIIPVFLTFSNDVFSFFIYEFQDPNVYNSIKLVQQRNYIISPEPITLNDIYDVLTATKIEPEPEIPFPQCNNFERIVDLLGLLMQNKEMTTSDITTNYAFVYRQTSYYTNGAIYLGLIEKFDNDNGEICYRLTSLGQSIMSKHHKQKNLDIVKQILKHEAFYKALQSYFKKSSPLSNQEISEIMKCCNLYHVTSQNTVERRAQTVSRWIEWILDLQE
jgi:predicted transcriptional regulator